MATEGKIVNLESPSSEALFPRTKVKAISDDNNVGLEVLLEGKADTNEVVPITRTINSKALSSNISLTAADVGARASTWVPSASDITSGTLSSDRLPTVPVAKGGTGATTAAGALTNLGITATAAELNKLDGVTATTAELNYVDGVTSNIQTQLNAKVPTTRTINGKALSANITLTAANVGAIPATLTNSYYGTSLPAAGTAGRIFFKKVT